MSIETRPFKRRDRVVTNRQSTQMRPVGSTFESTDAVVLDGELFQFGTAIQTLQEKIRLYVSSESYFSVADWSRGAKVANLMKSSTSLEYHQGLRRKGKRNMSQARQEHETSAVLKESTFST